ncbi:UPF0146 family protein [Halorubrum sp. AD140]|uniref:UPF0146 family protein n=1 Tax=Halorubrum sp. AD140 TaxID=3050073 RepID=UPI002ACC7E4B|nr:UPF0146 family protein [Halorubrum sp. AD140]MDZ5812122.1 UPF0146 family protein [Halorubrum sp. AD140]
MVSPSRLALVDALARYDRLLEVGIGDRPGVARALADRGRDVVALDVDVDERTRAAARETETATVAGSLRAVEGDVLALAEGTDRAGRSELDEAGRAFDAVYACNLPAELQRPTVAVAERLDAACLFTTLGFEEPTVPVSRRSRSGTTVYVARDGPTGDGVPGVDGDR